MISPSVTKGMLTVPHQRRPLSTHEKLMGQRMLASVRQCPQFTVAVDVVMDAMLDYKAHVEPKISLTPLVLRCVAGALQEFPVLNAMLCDDEVVTFDSINLSVAMDTPFGLRVPVIRQTERLSPYEIADQLKQLAERAQENRLSLSDMSQGTITVSNLGMLNVTHFAPIVNPPQVAIIGIAAIRPNLQMTEDGRVVSQSLMGVTLTSDHRIIDGATAARFLNVLKERMEGAIDD
jgi:pyruvate dehydrogenase E2 component (dihydrolipoamide acetyltransferase)